MECEDEKRRGKLDRRDGKINGLCEGKIRLEGLKIKNEDDEDKDEIKGLIWVNNHIANKKGKRLCRRNVGVCKSSCTCEEYRFETYVKTKDFDLWHIIVDGDYKPVVRNMDAGKNETLPYEKLKDDNKKMLSKNNEAKMVLYNDLPKKEYERIFMCKTAKDIWNLLNHSSRLPRSNSRYDMNWVIVDKLTKIVVEDLLRGFGRHCRRHWEHGLNMRTTYHPQTDGQIIIRVFDVPYLKRGMEGSVGHMFFGLKLEKFGRLDQNWYKRQQIRVEVGDKVMLEVSSWKEVVHFGKKEMLAPRYKYLADTNLHVHFEEIKVDKTLCFVEEDPSEIIVMRLKVEV
ncbi:hypothetical protein Tco_0446101 [Tanacetum coccineum]